MIDMLKTYVVPNYLNTNHKKARLIIWTREKGKILLVNFLIN